MEVSESELTPDGDGNLTASAISGLGLNSGGKSDEHVKLQPIGQQTMPPISPLDRDVSCSEKSLDVPEDALEDTSGLCNEGFESDRSKFPHVEGECPSNGSLKDEGVDRNDLEEEQEKLEKQLTSKSDCNCESSPHNKVNDANGVPKDLNRLIHPNEDNSGLSGPPVSTKGNSHSRKASTDGSTIETLCSPVIESRKGTFSDSGSLPVGMYQEEIPIIEENRGLSNINEKIGMHDGTEKQEYSVHNMKNGMHNLSRMLLHKHNVLPQDPTKGDKVKYAFSCPPHGKVGRILTYIFMLFLFWGALVYIAPEKALPGGTLFSLIILVIVAQLGGILVSKIRLPPLLGMLLVGIMFRSVPILDTIGNGIEPEWSSSLRSMALVVILIRAGLGLDPTALRKLSFVVLRLAVTPCLVETVTVAVVSHYLLDFPWKWGFLLGFVLAAVSPAVVVPCLLNLADQGYGVEKGIPTLVIAAASIDDVIAISGFGVCLGTIFSKGSALWQGLKGPLEFGMGITYGIVIGYILWLLPSKREENVVIYRFFLLFAAGLLAIFGSKGIDFGGAGALGCLCVAFVAGYGWRTRGRPEIKGVKQMQVNEYFNILWLFFQPLLFSLIGTEIRISELHPSTVGWGLVTLAIGLTLRVIVSFFAVMGGNLNLKERFFVALAWLPKATVQAAIGSTALDYARDSIGLDYAGDDDSVLKSNHEEILGIKVLTIAVLVILVTAPIGAIAIMLSAPKLLKKTGEIQEKNSDLES